MQMHSINKDQRETVRQLLHTVLMRDMGTFTADRFKDWIKDTDQKFRRVAMTLQSAIRERTVSFTIRELRSRRVVFQFKSSTHVQFEDRDVVMSVDQVRGIVS